MPDWSLLYFPQIKEDFSKQQFYYISSLYITNIFLLFQNKSTAINSLNTNFCELIYTCTSYLISSGFMSSP